MLVTELAIALYLHYQVSCQLSFKWRPERMTCKSHPSTVSNQLMLHKSAETVLIRHLAEALRFQEAVVVVAELVAADLAVVVDLVGRTHHCQGRGRSVNSA